MGQISKPYPDWTTGVIPPAELNATFDTIYNEFNGGVDAANIEALAITDDELAVSVSSVTRFDEAFQDFTVTGLTVSAVGLVCTVAAGTAYVSGERITPTAANHTVSPSTTTYCDVSKDGTFDWNANASPATDYMRLAKIVSDASSCTITDMRTLKPVGADQIEANAILDLQSTFTTATTSTTSSSRVTLLTVNCNVLNGDTLLLFGNVMLSAAAAVNSYAGFTVGGSNSNIEATASIDSGTVTRSVTPVDVYAVTADNTALACALTYRTQNTTTTVTAASRTLIVVRIRPTG